MGKQVGNKKKKSDKSLFKYVPVYPKAPMDMKYHYYDDGVLKVNPNLFELVTDLGRLEEIFKGWEGKKVAIDTETTGLTFFKDFMVGFSVSVDKDFGIYVPLRHQIKRVDEVEEDLVDENGNVLYTKRGKKRTKKVKHETFFEHPANVDVKGALDLLWDLMKKSPLCIFFNLEFDATMFKNEGYDLIKEENIKLFDASILTYLFDAENKNWNNLKACSEIVLGRKPTKFEEALGGAGNFRYVDLDQGYPYAGSDSACTIGIYEQLGPKVRELLAKTKPIVIDGATKPYSVYHRDNELIQAFTDYYHHVDLCVDTEAAKRYKAKAEKELADAENKIYEYFDMGNFNLSPSSKAFQDAMKAKHIDTGLLTGTGNVSYGKKGIEVMSRKLRAVKEILRGFKYIEFDGSKLNKRASLNDFKLIEFITSYGKDVFKFRESTNYLLNLRTIEGVKMDKRELFEELKLLYKRENKKLEILKLIQKRSSLAKAVNSYIEKLTQVDTCHMHYNLKGTASGRLSSGNGSKNDKKKNHYFIDLNAQNLTKPHSAFYKAYRSDEEGNILGWKFEMVTEEYMHEHKDTEIIVEGSDPENNIRNCIVAPAGRYIASLDYSAQEYRAVAILSKDHKMLDNFKRGVDPHTATAYAIWGEENYDRQKRKKAKACVGEGTYLLTSNGYKTGDELDVEKDMLIDFNGEPQNWAKTVEDRELVRVTYDNGVVETYTPDHKVRVWNGREITWKQIQKLTKEDNIVQYVGLYNGGTNEPDVRDYTSAMYRLNEGVPTTFNINCKEFAYLAGIYLGDGNLMKYAPSRGHLVNKPRGISFCVETEMVETVSRYMQHLGLSPSVPTPIGKNGKVYKIDTSNVSFANLMNDLLGATDKKHLDSIFRTLWTKETWSYFLAGLIDTDGFVRSGRTEFATTLNAILDAAILACSIVGSKCHLEYKSTKYKGEKYDYLNLVLYDIPDLPQLVSRKTVRGKLSRQGGWSISKEDAEYWRSKYTEWGDNYRSKYYTTFNNIIKNGAKLVGSTLEVIRSKIPDFPIQPNMACVHVVKKEKIHSGKTFIIQTSNHLYSTLGAGNANCNFLMNYCGGPTTLAENLDIPLEEAKDIISNYEKAFFECINWKKKIQKFVIEKNDGVAFSIFGRPRQFKSVLSTSFRLKSGTKEFQSIPEKDRIYKGDAIYKAVERKIVSHAVQSCCGDICRWDLIRLYRKFFKNRDPHIDFYTTVHDEINFTIDKDCVVDYVREIDDIMTIHNLSKELPIETSIDLGYTLGILFPFEWEDETRTNLVPARV